ncbi:MAG: NAD(P)-dependent oxidoreductase, partial [Chloroflexota bacterium]|nr:NAD(P)-dependent oxidoreductase [Chloroflexota bacterium]
GAASWADVARAAATGSGLDASLVVGHHMDDAPDPSRRPSRVLASGRGQLLPAWEDALRRYLREREMAAPEAAESFGRVACRQGVAVDGEDVVLGAAAS